MPKSIAIYGLSALFILCFFSFCFAQEQITITTYYPSPFGSYRELRAIRLTVHPTRAMTANDGELLWGPGPWGILTPDQGGAIELGGLNAGGGAGTPYIDFHRDTVMANDFDARIIAVGNDRLAIDGVSVASFDARLSPGSIPPFVAGRAHTPGCIRYSFTRTSGRQTCPAGYAITQARVDPPPGATSGNFLCCQYQ